MNLRKFRQMLTEDEQKIIEEVSAEAVAMQHVSPTRAEKRRQDDCSTEANGMQVNRDTLMVLLSNKL